MAVACLAIFFALGFVFLKIADRQPMAGRDKTEHSIKISKQEKSRFEIFAFHPGFRNERFCGTISSESGRRG